MTDVDVLRGGSVKKDDTHPPLRVQCLDEQGEPFHLGDYNATFKMRRSDGDSNKIDESIDIEQPERGIVQYAWGAGDTDTAGTFDAEIVADEDPGTNIVTFPNRGYFTIIIEEGL